jgi:hypothetical protein
MPRYFLVVDVQRDHSFDDLSDVAIWAEIRLSDRGLNAGSGEVADSARQAIGRPGWYIQGKDFYCDPLHSPDVASAIFGVLILWFGYYLWRQIQDR